MTGEELSQEVFIEKLNNIVGTMQRLEKKTESIDCKLDVYENRLRTLEKADLVTSTINKAAIDAAHNRIDRVEIRVDTLEINWEKMISNISSIQTKLNIVGIVGGASLVALIGIIGQLITHGGSLLK
jgi:chaperonin cofactor prefoldin